MRIRFGVASFLVLLLGYWIRFTPLAPAWLRDSGGGALYVVLLALLAAVVRPRAHLGWLAAGAFGVTCAVEFLQLWHPAWLEALRHTFPGRLVLGTTFLWSDFPPYAGGAVLGYLLLRFISGRDGERGRG